MKSGLLAEFAIFIKLDSVRSILFILVIVVITLLAFSTCECNSCPHMKDLQKNYTSIGAYIIYHIKYIKSTNFYNFINEFFTADIAALLIPINIIKNFVSNRIN